jgi:hypothetical protein
MTKETRAYYFGTAWPQACRAQRWDPKDDDKRRAVTLEAMALVHGPRYDSITLLEDAQITALFCYLRHLAQPENLTRARDWNDCCADYKAFNLSRQADFWERKAFGPRGAARLHQNRFAGRQRAASSEFTDRPLTEKEARDRLLTMRKHAKKNAPRRYEMDATPRAYVPRPVKVETPF